MVKFTQEEYEDHGLILFQITYDQLVDALHFKIRNNKFAKSDQLTRSNNIEYDNQGVFIGIEILRFSSHNIELNNVLAMKEDQILEYIVKEADIPISTIPAHLQQFFDNLRDMQELLAKYNIKSISRLEENIAQGHLEGHPTYEDYLEGLLLLASLKEKKGKLVSFIDQLDQDKYQ